MDLDKIQADVRADIERQLGRIDDRIPSQQKNERFKAKVEFLAAVAFNAGSSWSGGAYCRKNIEEAIYRDTAIDFLYHMSRG